MAEESVKKGKVNSLIAFIGIILLIIGIYASLKTALNFALFAKYPSNGVLALNFTGYPVSYQTERDCTWPQIYYAPDGKTVRPTTVDEKVNEKIQQSNCIENVQEQRQNAKINDISQSALFFLLGIGVLAARRKVLS